eukprot:5094682-Karenia_brevis.AAC.1
MPNPGAAAAAAELVAAAAAAQPTPQLIDVLIQDSEIKDAEYVWRCCECGEAYDEDEVQRNGKG